MKQPEVHLGANDSDPLGWITFTLYMIAAAFSLRTAFVFRSQRTASLWPIWSLIAVATLLLGLNKQLDLQTWLIRAGRRLAEGEHIIRYRLVIHVTFFLIVFGITGFLTVRWLDKIKSFGRRFQLGTTGCALIASYILLRATSINHIDQLFGLDFENLEAIWLLEMVGLVMLIAETLRIKPSADANGT